MENHINYQRIERVIGFLENNFRHQPDLDVVAPQEYRARGAGIRIEFGIHQTPFGLCLLGATERGICWLSFMLSAALTPYLTTRMPVLWLCVGTCRTGIGVVSVNFFLEF